MRQTDGGHNSAHQRRDRHVHILRTRRHSLQKLLLSERHRGDNAPQLHLPQHRTRHHVQRPSHPFTQRSARPAERPDDLRAPIPHHSHDGRGHRDSLYTHKPERRGIRLLRKRTAHHAGRHTPVSLQRAHSQDNKGVLRQVRVRRHTQRTRGGDSGERGRTHLRVADKDKTRLADHVTRRRLRKQIRGRLREKRGGQLPAP